MCIGELREPRTGSDRRAQTKLVQRAALSTWWVQTVGRAWVRADPARREAQKARALCPQGHIPSRRGWMLLRQRHTTNMKPTNEQPRSRQQRLSRVWTKSCCGRSEEYREDRDCRNRAGQQRITDAGSPVVICCNGGQLGASRPR